MDEMRALLDSLMGSDRNSVTTAPSRASFKDPGVCHSYLVDFCPHDLFPNTKSDLGPCPNKHSDAFKEQYLNDPEYEYYKKKYEKEFLNTLHRLVEGVEERIRRGQQRILGPDETQVEQDKQRKFDQMKDEIASLLQKAQEAGEKGNISEAETYTRKVTEIRCDLDRMSNLSHEFLAISNQEKSLRVCPVCGAMQSLGDATSRFESHVSGKQHVGYERIRATYAALKAKYRGGTTTGPAGDISDTTKETHKERNSRSPVSRKKEHDKKSVEKKRSSSIKREKSDGKYRAESRNRYQSSRHSSPSKSRRRDRGKSLSYHRHRHSRHCHSKDNDDYYHRHYRHRSRSRDRRDSSLYKYRINHSDHHRRHHSSRHYDIDHYNTNSSSVPTSSPTKNSYYASHYRSKQRKSHSPSVSNDNHSHKKSTHYRDLSSKELHHHRRQTKSLSEKKK